MHLGRFSYFSADQSLATRPSPSATSGNKDYDVDVKTVQ